MLKSMLGDHCLSSYIFLACFSPSQEKTTTWHLLYFSEEAVVTLWKYSSSSQRSVCAVNEYSVWKEFHHDIRRPLWQQCMWPSMVVLGAGEAVASEVHSSGRRRMR